MGCAMSSISKRDGASGGDNAALSVCRDRKRLVKKAVKQRLAFADAHSAYIHSLSSVSSAIALFVARYSAPTTCQFHITFTPYSSPSSSSSNTAPPPPPPKPILTATPTSEEEASESGTGRVCEHFYDDEPHQVEGSEVKWDFFNLLDTEPKPKPGESGESKVNSEEEQQKGKDDEQRNDNGNGNGYGYGNRYLLEALKDVEDHFARAYESGLDVSRMLEVNQIPSNPAFHDPPENSSSKWSISSRSSSCKSLLTSSSRCTSSTWAESRGDHKSLLSSSSENSSTWTESTTDATFWGMVSGSHSFTLGRLYAWEKKLYHEVKTGGQTQKIYKQKYSQLRKKDLEGDDLCPSKVTSEVTDLYHRIMVTVQHAESISKQIEKLRDEELQPQLIELLHGLMRTWKAMLETHELQKKIMREIRSFSCPDHEKFCNDSHHLATLQLEAAIQNWYSCFSEYVSAQKAYVKSLHGWLSKFIDAETEYYYKGRSSLPPIRFNGPTLMVICQSWLTSLERLPEKALKNAMKSLAKDIQALCVQQGEEQQQKRKVDGLTKEMNRKIHAFKRAEDKALIMPNHIAHSNLKDQVESFNEKKNQLDLFNKRIEMEKERYMSSVQETKRVMVKGFHMGFSSVFESLADFSRASVKVYADLVTFSQNAQV